MQLYARISAEAVEKRRIFEREPRDSSLSFLWIFGEKRARSRAREKEESKVDDLFLWPAVPAFFPASRNQFCPRIV